MRRIVVLISAFLLVTACTMAQFGGGSESENQPGKNLIIVEGCLDESVGSYNLTDPTGASYLLAGKTEKLKNHIGQSIRVTAIAKPLVHVPGSMSEGTQTKPTLSVITFNRLSNICTFGENNIP